MYSQNSRGSITSGIPIETISSDDEESSLFKSKKPRTRQAVELNHELSSYRTNREQTIDGSLGNRTLMNHRGSEPNHMEILLSNRYLIFNYFYHF